MSIDFDNIVYTDNGDGTFSYDGGWHLPDGTPSDPFGENE